MDDAVIAEVPAVVARYDVARRREPPAVLHGRGRSADGIRLRDRTEACKIERAVPAMAVERDTRSVEIRLRPGAGGRADHRERDGTAAHHVHVERAGDQPALPNQAV